MSNKIVNRMRTGWANLDPMVPMIPIATLVGFLSANAVEGFRWVMYAIIHLYSRSEHLVAKDLSSWQRVAIPTACATVGGLIMWGGRRWLKQRRGPEYMEAVLVGNGVLPFAPNITRTFSSLISVSGGITIGREGTMIQFAALISSLFGRRLWADPEHRRLIVACGAAAGFAGAYHAPIAGTLFVSEVILGGLALREITAILVSAVVGELTTQALYASGPLYIAQAITKVGFYDFAAAIAFGAVCGVIGPAFLWLLDNTRSLFQAYVRPLPLRMGIAGLLIGLLSLLRPEVWGNGYSVVQSTLLEPWTLMAVAEVFILRLIGVTAASAAGIPGGVLTPTLALGGALGIFALHLLMPTTASHSQALWVLVGMGSLLAATTHAPAMSAIMMFETTRNYDVVLAAMPACATASVISSLLRSRTVYSEALGQTEGTGKPSLLDAVTGRPRDGR